MVKNKIVNWKLEIGNYYLYLDTSEKEAVLAIFENENKLAETVWEGHRELSRTLTAKYQALLKKAGVKQEELAGIIVFVGPGSFTGLRIGISFANGLAFGLGIPVFETEEKEKFSLENPQELALPFYGAEPHITKPKRD